jgi:hypothetical protein
MSSHDEAQITLRNVGLLMNAQFGSREADQSSRENEEKTNTERHGAENQPA